MNLTNEEITIIRTFKEWTYRLFRTTPGDASTNPPFDATPNSGMNGEILLNGGKMVLVVIRDKNMNVRYNLVNIHNQKYVVATGGQLSEILLAGLFDSIRSRFICKTPR